MKVVGYIDDKRVEYEVSEEVYYPNWHVNERPLRIVLTQDVWKDWLFKKREHEDMYELTGVELYPELVAVIGIINYLRDYVVVSEGNIYIYLEEIYPEHEFIIKNYMGIIERKQIV